LTDGAQGLPPRSPDSLEEADNPIAKTSYWFLEDKGTSFNQS
jgi:hypothetical protein